MSIFVLCKISNCRSGFYSAFLGTEIEKMKNGLMRQDEIIFYRQIFVMMPGDKSTSRLDKTLTKFDLNLKLKN